MRRHLLSMYSKHSRCNMQSRHSMHAHDGSKWGLIGRL